jgi:hypothetical protein
MKKEDAQQYVRRQKELYLDIVVYLFISAVLTGIWFMYDHGTNFWPKYIYFWGGLYIVYKFIKAGNLAFLRGVLPFADPDWEEKKVTKLTSKPEEKKVVKLASKPVATKSKKK